MSDIDKELTWESPIRTVAWEVLHKSDNDTLDFDMINGLALQARVLPGYISPALWPQLIFKPSGEIYLYADEQELQAVGHEKFHRSFHAHLMSARNTLRDGSKRPRWLWKRMNQTPKVCSYPPRVFTRHTFAEFNDKMHFECRYLEPFDRNRLLSLLDKWRPFEGKQVFGQNPGVAEPEAHYSYRPRYVLRGLVKIGLNLLSHVCERTEVGRATFPDATAYVRYDQGGPKENEAGFVVNEDIQCLNCPPDAHKFTLQHVDGRWQLLCSFFGGRIGATVSFPGPNHEIWRRVEIVAPLHSRDWQITTGRLYLPIRVCIEWLDLSRIIPTIPIKNLEAQVRHEPVQSRKPSS